jgi:hypothetical protein
MCLKFILINFIVSFFSDLILNLLSQFKKSPASIRALQPYFKYYNSSILTAVYAGITVVSVLLITILFSSFFLGFTEPRNKKELLKFLLLAFPLGYSADVLIYKYHIFGKSLDPFYKIAGAGFWGAIAFLASIVISYLFLIYLYKT